MPEIKSSDPTVPRVTVVLPSYCEEEAIAKVIDDIRVAMKASAETFEILVVDDCSRDKTADIAEAAGVRVIRRIVQGGSGASRRTGIKEARGEIIVMLDADGTYEAGDIPKLLEYIPAYDQVNGARTSEKGTLRILRTPAKWFIRQFACYLTSTHIPDLNTGLKAFKKDVMKRYLWVLPNGFSCVTTMTLAFLANGHPVKYIPTEYHTRIGKSKFHPLKDTLAYINTVVRMIMYFRPLRVFMPLSAFMMLTGILKAGWSLRGTASLQESDIILIVSSILLASLGLIADLIVAYNNRE